MRRSLISFLLLACSNLFGQQNPNATPEDLLNDVEQESTAFGDWFVGSDETYVMAMTRPDRTSKVLIYMCFRASPYCLTAVNLDLGCKKDDRYSVLVNHPSAALAVEAICGSGDGGSSLMIADKGLLNLLRSDTGGHIGFAVGMEGGLFKVVRFSLDGSREATAYVDRLTDATEYK